MRKVDRLKKLHAPIDDKYKKIDTTVNGDAERLAEQHKEVERRLLLLLDCTSRWLQCAGMGETKSRA